MQNIMSPLQKTVQSNEQSISSQFPASFSFGLVFKIGIFELGADIDALLEFFAGFWGFFIGDNSEDGLTVDEILSLVNNGITDFSDKDNKSGGIIVESGFLIDHKNSVHDRDK
jgi:hypothetical protein